MYVFVTPWNFSPIQAQFSHELPSELAVEAICKHQWPSYILGIESLAVVTRMLSDDRRHHPGPIYTYLQRAHSRMRKSATRGTPLGRPHVHHLVERSPESRAACGHWMTIPILILYPQKSPRKSPQNPHTHRTAEPYVFSSYVIDRLVSPGIDRPRYLWCKHHNGITTSNGETITVKINLKLHGLFGDIQTSAAYTVRTRMVHRMVCLFTSNTTRPSFSLHWRA